VEPQLWLEVEQLPQLLPMPGLENADILRLTSVEPQAGQTWLSASARRITN
jgi:hypothetical protein